MVNRLTTMLLWRHISRSSHDVARLSEFLAIFRRDRDAKINKVRRFPIWGDDNVLWLDIPMYDSQSVCVLQGRRDLMEPSTCQSDRNRPRLNKGLSQSLAFNELKDDQKVLLGILNVVDGGNVRM